MLVLVGDVALPGGPDAVPRPPRRKRYAGTHPRQFGDKYKELAPDAFPEAIAHVRSKGNTPAGSHVPIMVSECLRLLSLNPGDRVADATLGHGGHASSMLAAVSPGGTLLAVDVDPLELPKAEARLRAAAALLPEAAALTVKQCNYAGLSECVPVQGEGFEAVCRPRVSDSRGVNI